MTTTTMALRTRRAQPPLTVLSSFCLGNGRSTGQPCDLAPHGSYDPPPHHPRLKLELRDGITNPRSDKPRPMAIGHIKDATEWTEERLKTKHIEPSTSPVASQLLIFPKPKKHPLDKPTKRVVVDMRTINTQVVHHSYRLPTCDTLWYSLDKAKYISTADMKDGYWLAPLDSQSRWLTAFDTPVGRMQWKCVPMGLQPSAAGAHRRSP